MSDAPGRESGSEPAKFAEPQPPASPDVAEGVDAATATLPAVPPPFVPPAQQPFAEPPAPVQPQQQSYPMSQPQPQPVQPPPGMQPPAGPAQPTYAVYVQQSAPVYVKPEPRGFSVASMVLGLVSIVFGFTFVLPIAALIFGIIGMKREPAGRGMAIVGIIIGGIDLLFWLLLGGAIFAFFATLFGAAAVSA